MTIPSPIQPIPNLPITRPRRTDQPGGSALGTLSETEFDDPKAGDQVQIAVLDTWPMLADHTDLLGNIAGFRAALLGAGGIEEEDKNRILRRFDWAANFVQNEPINIKDVYSSHATPGEPRCSRVPCGGKRKVPEQMPDHGLFIADLIHQIAPGAPLSIYRVLNDWGVSDLRSVAKALEDAIIAARKQPLVVNLSLGVCPQLFVIPALIARQAETVRTEVRVDGVTRVEEETKEITGAEVALRDSEDWMAREHTLAVAHKRTDSRDGPWDAETQAPNAPASGGGPASAPQSAASSGGGDSDALTLAGIGRAIDILFRGQSLPANVLLVAASGNDSCPGLLSEPRLPAAIEGVLGVSAAVPTDEPADGPAGGVKWRRSTFSNADDLTAPDDGVAAFSGDITFDIDPDRDGLSTDAAVALYVADRRPGVNDDGFVQWSGTSFAAPLVTAYAAVIWTAALRAGDTVDASGVLEAIVQLPENGGGRRLVPLAPRPLA